jgi:hypothetical protein
MLTFDRKEQRVAVSAEQLHQLEFEGNTFVEHIVTNDETWVYCFTQDSKQLSME